MYCYGVACYKLSPMMAELIGSYIGLTIWGFYVCLFAVTMWMLRERRRWTPAIAGITTLFIINIVQTVVTVIRGYKVFIENGTDPLEFLVLHLFVGWIPLLYDLLFILANIVSDAVLWWRLYIIWARDRRLLVIPALGMTAALIGGSYILALDIIKASRPLTDAEAHRYTRWAEAMLTIDFVNNWLVTLMIIWKLWRVGRRAMSITSRQTNRYLSIILALVESGILYSVVLGVYDLLWYADLQSVAQLFNPSLTRVTAIVPVMIMLQLSLGYEQPADTLEEEAPFSQRTRPLVQTWPVRIARPTSDSLSLDISATPPSVQGSEDTVRDEQVATTYGPWKTVGGTDVAMQQARVAREVDLEAAGQARRKSSEF